MAEQQKPSPQAPSGRIAQMDTTAGSILEKYLKPTQQKLKELEKKDHEFHAATVLKMAFIRFAADCAKLSGDDRAMFIRQLDATPLWFPTNPSACRQAYERKGGVEAAMRAYSDY